MVKLKSVREWGAIPRRAAAAHTVLAQPAQQAESWQLEDRELQPESWARLG